MSGRCCVRTRITVHPACMSVTTYPQKIGTAPTPTRAPQPLPPIAVPDDAFCSSIPEAIKWRLIGWLGSKLRLDRFPAKRLQTSPVILQLGAGRDTPSHVVNAEIGRAHV